MHTKNVYDFSLLEHKVADCVTYVVKNYEENPQDKAVLYATLNT